MLIFFILALCTLPILLTFGEEPPYIGDSITRYSLGNMLSDIGVCQNAYMKQERLYLHCPSENLQVASVEAMNLLKEGETFDYKCVFSKPTDCS